LVETAGKDVGVDRLDEQILEERDGVNREGREEGRVRENLLRAEERVSEWFEDRGRGKGREKTYASFRSEGKNRQLFQFRLLLGGQAWVLITSTYIR